MLPKIERILYTSTLSPKAPYIFRYAISQAQHYQASIYFLHVMEPMSSFAQSIVEQYLSEEQKQKLQQDNLDWLKDKIQSRIHNFCAKETCDLDSQDPVQEILIKQGQPAETILKTAQNLNADLIIMGAHRKTRFIPGFLGSTTRRVIDNSQIPVLCINTPQEFHDDLSEPVY